MQLSMMRTAAHGSQRGANVVTVLALAFIATVFVADHSAVLQWLGGLVWFGLCVAGLLWLRRPAGRRQDPS